MLWNLYDCNKIFPLLDNFYKFDIDFYKFYKFDIGVYSDSHVWPHISQKHTQFWWL